MSTVTDQEKEAPRIAQHLLDAPVLESFPYELVSDEKVKLTIPFANEHLALPEFVGERPFSNAHVEHLISEAKSGNFVPEQVTLMRCYCEWDNKMRRLNGQHTCWMRDSMPADWTKSVRLQTYKVKTEAMFRRLYAATDRGRARSSNDVIRAIIKDRGPFKSMPEKIHRLLATGIRLLEMGTEGNTGVTPDEVGKLLVKSKYSDVAVQVGYYLNSAGSDQKHVKNGSVVAAMIASFDKSPSAARAFWNAVRTGVNINSEDDPRSRLRVLLMTSKIEGGSNSKSERSRSMSRRDVVSVCIHAWNMFREEKTIKSLRVPTTRPVAK